jgi:hypothetical protein
MTPGSMPRKDHLVTVIGTTPLLRNWKPKETSPAGLVAHSTWL